MSSSRSIILSTTVSADLGGIARSVPMLAASCAKGFGNRGTREFEVVMVAPRAERDTLEAIRGIELVNVRRCDCRVGVRRELEKLTANTSNPISFVYHAGVWNPLNHFVARLGRRRGIPVVVSPRSMLDPWALNHRKWKKRLAWWAYARRDLLGAAAIHATAELEAGYVRRALGRKCPPVIVVPNGVELPGGETTKDTKGTKGVRRVLFLSRIHEKKGVVDLIRAFGELNLDGWELVIAGNDDPSTGSGLAGSYRAVCEQVARAQPNAGRISFPGAVRDTDKWDLYRSADLFVLPSYSENFGIVVGEALGMGVPVVTTTETPWGEFVGDFSHTEARSHGEELGLWVVETGVETVKQAMREAMGLSDEERRVRGARGAEWIRREFAWEAIGRKFLEEVGKVIPLK